MANNVNKRQHWYPMDENHRIHSAWNGSSIKKSDASSDLSKSNFNTVDVKL